MTNHTPESLARIAYDAYFADELTDADAILAYIDDCFADELRDALDTDIADLLHNANADELFAALSDAELDDALESLRDYDFFDDFIDQLAIIITA